MIKLLLIVLSISLVLRFTIKIDINHKFFLLIIFVLSSIWIVISNQLVSFWLALETQSFSLILLIIYDDYKRLENIEAVFKYLLLSAISSVVLLLGIFYLESCQNFLYGFNYLLDYKGSVIWLFLVFPLILKLGSSPLHFWVPEVYRGIGYFSILLLSTLPKLVLIYFLFKLNINSNLIYIVSITSLLFGSVGGLNQSSLKKLLAFSGISHLGLILVSYSLFFYCFFDFSLFYYVIYIIANIGIIIILIFNEHKLLTIELSNYVVFSRVYSVILIIFLISWLGLPPLSGFLGKWIIIIGAIHSHSSLLVLFIIVSTILTSFFYLRLILFNFLEGSYGNIVLLSKSGNFNIEKSNFSKFLVFLIYIILFLIFAPNLINLIVLNDNIYIFLPKINSFNWLSWTVVQ